MEMKNDHACFCKQASKQVATVAGDRRRRGGRSRHMRSVSSRGTPALEQLPTHPQLHRTALHWRVDQVKRLWGRALRKLLYAQEIAKALEPTAAISDTEQTLLATQRGSGATHTPTPTPRLHGWRAGGSTCWFRS